VTQLLCPHTRLRGLFIDYTGMAPELAAAGDDVSKQWPAPAGVWPATQAAAAAVARPCCCQGWVGQWVACPQEVRTALRCTLR